MGAYLLKAAAGAGEKPEEEVAGNTDHGAEGQTESEHLRPPRVRVAVVVRQQPELRPHPHEDALTTQQLLMTERRVSTHRSQLAELTHVFHDVRTRCYGLDEKRPSYHSDERREDEPAEHHERVDAESQHHLQVVVEALHAVDPGHRHALKEADPQQRHATRRVVVKHLEDVHAALEHQTSLQCSASYLFIIFTTCARATKALQGKTAKFCHAKRAHNNVQVQDRQIH